MPELRRQTVNSMEREDWTNVLKHEKKDFLPSEEFIKLRDDLRGAWRSLGWLHLRMTNDIDTQNKSPLTRAELYRRLDEIKKEVERLMGVYLD